MNGRISIAERADRVVVENSLVRFSFDAAQGGNCVEGLWKPLNAALLCTNFHSTDVFANADGVGYYTTGDRQGALTVRVS